MQKEKIGKISDQILLDRLERIIQQTRRLLAAFSQPT